MVISKSQAKQIADQADRIFKAHDEIDKAKKCLEVVTHIDHVFGVNTLRVTIPPGVACDLVLAHIANNERLLVELSTEVRDALNADGM